LTTVESRTVVTRIEQPFARVYGFLAKPENFVLWASGLAGSLHRENETWKADGPSGPVTIRFTPPNEFGIADHTVVLADGRGVVVPMRVLANGDGSEVHLTLFRLPEMDDRTFARDADWVSRDLKALRRLLEE
jgi:hypothetical protein